MFFFEFDFPLLIIILIILFTLYFLKRRIFSTKQRRIIKSQQKIQSNFRSGKHIWKPFTKKGIYYCNQCEQLMGGIMCNGSSECSKCGFLIHNFCKYKKKNEKVQKCKFVTTETDITPHQFVEGNLPFNSICSVCDLICSSMYELKGAKCLWCLRTVHTECRDKLHEQCDMGPLKNLVLRPNQVRYIQNSPKKLQQNQRLHSDDTETELDIQKKQGWSFKSTLSQNPVVIVINKKSGGQLGEVFMNAFYRHVNPIQVIDLLQVGLDRLIQFKDVNNLKILVCGGDGTVASVSNFMKNCGVRKWIDKNPPIAILPIGTGNDLGRALGWGGGGQTEDQVQEILELVDQKAVPVLHDRWQVTLPKEKESQMMLYNYFSVGLDARVCYGFHEMREKYPYLFKSRIGNKFIYTNIGTLDMLNSHKDMIVGNPKRLDEVVTLKVDGHIIELPECENLAFVNISSWAGGAQNLWLDEKQIKESNNQHIYKTQSFCDGIIEVLGVKSILHLGQVQTNLTEPIRICQGKKIELTFQEKQHIQIDGEPLIVKPQTIVLERKDQVHMLANSKQQNTRESVNLQFESKILSTLEWAESQKHINSEQKNLLLKKFLQ